MRLLREGNMRRYIYGSMVTATCTYRQARYFVTILFFSENLFFYHFQPKKIYCSQFVLLLKNVRLVVRHHNMCHITHFDDYWLRYSRISVTRPQLPFIDLSFISKSTWREHAAHVFSESPRSALSHRRTILTKSVLSCEWHDFLENMEKSADFEKEFSIIFSLLPNQCTHMQCTHSWNLQRYTHTVSSKNQ